LIYSFFFCRRKLITFTQIGELVNNRDILFYDMIEGAIVNMDVYVIYAGLVKAIATGNIEETLKQGVSFKVPWNSPAAEYMYQREKLLYIKERAGMALFIAAHRGNVDLVKALLDHS
jgi:endoglucanase Acf2